MLLLISKVQSELETPYAHIVSKNVSNVLTILNLMMTIQIFIMSAHTQVYLPFPSAMH